MPSLVKTLRRWYATVCRLMNSRAPISAFERPSQARRDLGLLGGQLVAGLDGAFADMLAGRQELALGPSGERLGPHAREHLERGAQLFAGVEPAALAPQPLAVEQVGAGELHADARACEPFDRLAIEAVGLVAFVEERAAAGVDPECPVGAAGAGRLQYARERVGRELGLSRPGSGLDQLGQRPDSRALLVEALGLAGDGQGLVGATEAVVKDAAQELGHGQREPLAPRLGLADRRFDQPGELGLAPA